MYKRAYAGKFICTFIIAVVVLLGGNAAYGDNSHAQTASDNSQIKVMLDGSTLNFDVPPTIVDGRTLVPLRIIFEEMGATVNWNPSSGTITGIKGDKTISLKVNSKNAYVNGKLIQIDVPASVVNGRTLVPTRFIAESLGADVAWDRETRTVFIDSPIIVTFPDKNLEEVIRKRLKKSSGDIYTFDLRDIKSLSAPGKNISNLEGIQYLKSIEELDLANNNIGDISMLANSQGLRVLILSQNRIADISPLRNLSNLMAVDLGTNQVTDISPLKSLTKLGTLDLSMNQIYDISPLEDVKSLRWLNLYSNPIIDISALKGLTNLKDLYLMHTNKKDPINDELFNKFDIMSKKVEEIVGKTIRPEMSELEKELALHDYIITHTRYDVENFNKNTLPDESHLPYGVLVNGTAVCDGYARTFQILLHAVGIESKMVVGNLDSLDGSLPGLTTDNKEIKWKHAWNIVKIDNKYYQVDVTADDPVTTDGTNLLDHTYFNISDKQLAVDHKWDRQAYPECLDDSRDYTMKAGEKRDVIISDDSCYYIDDSGLLHKKSLDGTGDIKLCEDRVTNINLYGDWIYYINKSDNMKVYRVKTDGSQRVRHNDAKTIGISVYNNLVYCLVDYKIEVTNLDGTGKTILNSDDITTWIDVSEEGIFFKAFNWGSKVGLYRVGLDGSGRIRLCNEEPTGFSLSSDGREVNFLYGNFEHRVDDWIYFINESDGKKIYKVKIDGSQVVKLGDESTDIRSVEFLDRYIYYRSSDGSGKYYRVNMDGTQKQLLE